MKEMKILHKFLRLEGRRIGLVKKFLGEISPLELGDNPFYVVPEPIVLDL